MLPFRKLNARYAGYVMAALWGVALLAALLIAVLDTRLTAVRARRRFWIATFGIALTLDVAYAIYVVAIPPVNSAFGMPVAGDWIGVLSVDAPRLDYIRYYLKNVRDGRRIDFARQARLFVGRSLTSSDGLHVFWDSDPVVHADLDRGRAESLALAGHIVAVAPDGSRVAVARERRLVVYGLPGGKALRELSVPDIASVQLSFADGEHFRVLVWKERTLRETVVGIRDGTERTRIVSVPSAAETYDYLGSSKSRQRIALVNRVLKKVTLLDGNFRLLREIATPSLIEEFLFLDDGRLATLSRGERPDRALLCIYDQAGNEQRSVSFEVLWPHLVAAQGPYVVLSGRRTWILNVDDGSMTSIQGFASLAFDGTGRMLGSDGFDVRRLDLRTGRSEVVFRGHQPPDWIYDLTRESTF